MEQHWRRQTRHLRWACLQKNPPKNSTITERCFVHVSESFSVNMFCKCIWWNLLKKHGQFFFFSFVLFKTRFQHTDAPRNDITKSKKYEYYDHFHCIVQRVCFFVCDFVWGVVSLCELTTIDINKTFHLFKYLILISCCL